MKPLYAYFTSLLFCIASIRNYDAENYIIAALFAIFSFIFIYAGITNLPNKPPENNQQPEDSNLRRISNIPEDNQPSPEDNKQPRRINNHRKTAKTPKDSQYPKDKR
jgi:hypothetical protein